MADPLAWKPGEGYDIHVVRGEFASKSLVGSLVLPAGNVPTTLKFSPQVGGGLSIFGLNVNQSTGEVSASLPPPNSSQAVINNFLMTVSIEDSSGKKYETEIRVHVHDSITDIWLTPSTLTIHKGADESRFTVLASFANGIIGDITDWSQLTYKSLDPSTQADSTDVVVTSKGLLKAVTPGKTAKIRVTLTLSSLSSPGTFSAEATAIAKPSWEELSAKANVNFVVAGLRSSPQKSGTVVPNKDDPNSANRDSVASVVANALNVLFVSEGFSRESDFNNLVNKIVEDLRTQDYLQPFKLVQDSINYWSVFVPSQEDGITLLTEFVVNAVAKPPPTFLGNYLLQPTKPSASATTWNLQEMTHEVGLPVSTDPTTLASIKDVWKLRYGDKPYPTLAATHFSNWRRMASAPTSWRSLLNEHDTAFGMRNSDRSRVAPTFGPVMLGSDSRRTSDTNIFKFVAGLNYGRHPVTFSTYNLGAAWNAGAKDAGLLCFLCQTQKHAGIRWGGYFLSSTGRSGSTNLKVTTTAKGASSVDIDNPAVSQWDLTLLATVVAHEFGHALGLGDEYGDGRGALQQIDHQAPNLLDKRIITTTTPGGPPMVDKVVYDKTHEIKWLWPRIIRAGVLNGTPQKSGRGLRVPLQKSHGKPFIFQDIVRFRETPVRVRPSQDPFRAYPTLSFIVTAHSDDSVDLVLGHPGGGVIVDVSLPHPGSSDPRPWGDVFLAMFKPGVRYALICPRRRPGIGAGIELNLVAEKIINQIALSNAPLNAPPGNEMAGQETAVCVAAGGVGSGNMTPTNLPSGLPLFNLAAFSDIIGIYEGGGVHDCGVFRPAGRCKMRGQFEQGIPFCHVCRYLIVDKVDPSKHGELDDIYDPFYPK